jgi:hypothetical protein
MLLVDQARCRSGTNHENGSQVPRSIAFANPDSPFGSATGGENLEGGTTSFASVMSRHEMSLWNLTDRRPMVVLTLR